MGKIHNSPDVAAALVAQEYFLGDRPRSLTAIAESFGVDKATVSRLLRRARDHHLLRMSFNLPREQDLEVRLTRKYSLADVAVFPVLIGDANHKLAYRRLFTEAAASHLESESSPLKDGMSVGISCGQTLRDFIRALTPGRYKNMNIAQLTIETEWEKFLDVAPVTLVGMLYGKWNETDDSRSTAWAVQPLRDTLKHVYEDCDKEREYSTIRSKIFNRAKDLDVAIVGIGYFGDSSDCGSFFRIMKERQIHASQFERKNTVGEICNRPFDAKGQDIFSEIDGLASIIDGVEIQTLRELIKKGRKVVAIAGGKAKARAIDVALYTGMINYLITDIEAAEVLCNI